MKSMKPTVVNPDVDGILLSAGLPMSGAQTPCLLDVCWSVTRPDWAPVDEQIQAWVLAAMVAGANAALPAQGVEVSLLFTNVSDIQRLNGEYRQIDKATNVLSFPAHR
ncbi:rRNA maturation RNAse YbeY [Pseudomonadales bacterium]|nr:rRNA maturation RNAse YbeY [Pseudomonadales bacterium]